MALPLATREAVREERFNDVWTNELNDASLTSHAITTAPTKSPRSACGALFSAPRP